MELSVQFGQFSPLLDLLVNNSQLIYFNRVLLHHFIFFGNDLQLEVLNQILIKRVGMNYNLKSSLRKRYFSDINFLLERNYIGCTEKFCATDAAKRTLNILKDAKYSNISWKISDENSFSYSAEKDTEVTMTNFSDKEGIVKLGKWKEARIKCLNKGLSIEPEKVTISKESHRFQDYEEKRGNSDFLRDFIKDSTRIARIIELKERLKTREVRRAERVKLNPVYVERIKKNDKESTILESKIEENQKKINELEASNSGNQGFHSPGTVLYAPSGSEKSRKKYFSSAIDHPFRSVISASKATRVQLAKKLEPLGWVVEGISGSPNDPDPNEKFRLITYSSDKKNEGKVVANDIDKKVFMIRKEIETYASKLKSMADENQSYIRFSKRNPAMDSSGDEKELDDLLSGLKPVAKPRIGGLSKEIRMPTSSVEKKPTVILFNKSNTMSGDVLTINEFSVPKKISKRKSKIYEKNKEKREKNENSIQLKNRFSVLEYSDVDFAEDIGRVIEKVGNLVELFKNVPLYKHIEVRKTAIKNKYDEKIDEILKIDDSVLLEKKADQCTKDHTIELQRKLRPNIYKSYKLSNSMNTLKKALFCARNGVYPSVNKKWVDGIDINLKRCQWHYLISTCRISLGVMDTNDIKGDGDHYRNHEEWYNETFL